MDVEELASDVRRARGFDDPAAFVEMMETSATTGLQDAGELVQVLLGGSRGQAFGPIKQDVVPFHYFKDE